MVQRDSLQKAYLSYDLRIDFLFLSGRLDVELGEFQTSREKLLEVIRLLEIDVQAKPLQIEQVRNWIGLSFYREQLYQQGLEQFKLCQAAIFQNQITDKRFKLWVMLNIANSHLALKNFGNALQIYTEAINSVKPGEDDLTRASAYWGLGETYRETSKLRQATSNLSRCVGIYERMGEKGLAARAKSLLGQILVDRKRYSEALEVLQEALKLTSSEDLLSLSLIYLNQAYAYFELSQFVEASQSIQTSIKYSSEIGDDLLLGQGFVQLARILMELGEVEQAISSFKEGIEVLKKTEDKTALRKAYKRYSEAARKMNLIEIALTALEAAYKC